MTSPEKFERREFLRLAAAAGFSLAVPSGRAESPGMRTRRIPATGEEIPVIGLGTSDEFNRVPAGGGEELQAVLTTLVGQGGRLIDTAPGYGDAEYNLGRFIDQLDLGDAIFMSTKIRSRGAEAGLRSIERSHELLRLEPIDLIMVHSLYDAETQLQNLRQWKEAGRVRYIGVTTSWDGGHERLESLIRTAGIDFVQVNYSPFETAAANRIIPAAADHGVAVMVNRAFGNGAYFGLVRGQTLPAWAEEFDCESWAQFSLKYILGHPDVTCVLAATSKSRHMLDNARAGYGRLPDQAARTRIEQHLQEFGAITRD